jgi:hypothetical protein
VANSKDWKEERSEVLVDIPSIEYDWTFHSEYSGTSSGASLEDAAEGIPYDKLKQKEEILFWDQLVLMEGIIWVFFHLIYICIMHLESFGFLLCFYCFFLNFFFRYEDLSRVWIGQSLPRVFGAFLHL